jgi:hypothetical protein
MAKTTAQGLDLDRFELSLNVAEAVEGGEKPEWSQPELRHWG